MHADSGQGAFRDCRYAIVVCRQIKPGQRGAGGRGVNPNPWCGILLRAALTWCSLKWISLAGSGDLSLEFCGNNWKRTSLFWRSYLPDSFGENKKCSQNWEHEGITCREGRRGGQSSTRLHTQPSTRRRHRVAEPPSSCWLICGSCGGGGKEQHLLLPRRFAFTRFLLIGKRSLFLSPRGK